MIQLAAASLKYEVKNFEGVKRLSTVALEKLENVQRAAGDTYLGVELGQLISKAKEQFTVSDNPDQEAAFKALRIRFA